MPVKVSEKASDNASAQFTTWSVSLKTYVPASIKGKKLDNLGIDLKVISRSGAEIVLPPLKVVKTVSYPRKHEFLQGRIDYFSIDLPAYFEDPAFTPVAVSVNDRWVSRMQQQVCHVSQCLRPACLLPAYEMPCHCHC